MDVGVAVTNLRVVRKNITSVSAMAISIFLEIVREINSCCKSVHSALQATRRMPLWALAIALATGKTIWLDGPELDTIFYLRVTACREQSREQSREQGSRCHEEAISLGSFTMAGDFMFQLVRLESLLERTTGELTTFILWLINSPCAQTGSNL